jgi:FMN-dependent NADH-azoreductase
VSCSPRGQASESYRLSQKIIGFLLKSEPTATLITRLIGGGAIAHIDENYAAALGATRPSAAELSLEGSFSRSGGVFRQPLAADHASRLRPQFRYRWLPDLTNCCGPFLYQAALNNYQIREAATQP